MSEASSLVRLLKRSEEDLMKRILAYAKRQDYVRYTSTLEEAWRLSIQGISSSLIESHKQSNEVEELHPDDDFTKDPISAFGLLEAQRHRERGVPLAMFLGLFKYYRQVYVDLVEDEGLSCHRLWIERSFDRIEIAFCAEWTRLGDQEKFADLQSKNRSMTNEKNRLLTVVESLSTPAILLDEADRITFQNTAATRLAEDDPLAPSSYYQAQHNPYQLTLEPEAEGECVTQHFPWIGDSLETFKKSEEPIRFQDVTLGDRYFSIQFARMRDVSGKYPGTVVVISDLTERRRAELQVKLLNHELEERNQVLSDAIERIETLEGILPMCASCKKIKEKDTWIDVDVYVSRRTRADISHGLCPDCGKRLYPEIFADDEL